MHDDDSTNTDDVVCTIGNRKSYIRTQGDPLPNANIVVVGTDLGTVSDETGTFVIDLGAGATQLQRLL